MAFPARQRAVSIVESRPLSVLPTVMSILTSVSSFCALQRAVSIVESWPFFPDVYSITTAAVAGHTHLMLEECCSS